MVVFAEVIKRAVDGQYFLVLKYS